MVKKADPADDKDTGKDTGKDALVRAADRDSEALVAVANRLPDAYEERYMSGQGTVLYREKRVASWPLHALMGANAVGSVAATIIAGAWPVALVLLPLMMLFWLVLGVLRVTVSDKSVTVQYGLFGPTVPIESIESVEATTYKWLKFGGWGIRRSRDGALLYNMPGDKGRAVRILWRDKKGKQKVLLLGTPEPDVLVAAINKARHALTGTDPTDVLPGGDASASALPGTSPKALDS